MKKIVLSSWGIIGWAVLSSVCLAYSGGDGSSEKPYKIANKNDLLELAVKTRDYDKCFVMINDIDLTGQSFTKAVIAPDTDDTLWGGFQGTEFTGVFDGAGHVISNLTIAGPGDYIGLFGAVSSSRSQIKNLGIVNANIQGFHPVGGIVAYSNQGQISYCYTTGFVTGGQTGVGGLAGYHYGDMTSCYSTACVNGANYRVGGLVGGFGGTMISCYATGTVDGGGNDVGGLVGDFWGTMISCYALGFVNGYMTIGGLVGWNNGAITSCYATGAVNGVVHEVGGLVGCNGGPLTFCYAMGAVSTDASYSDALGGLAGRNYSTITSCYATGFVDGNDGVGGLVGIHVNGPISGCYTTSFVSGTGDAVGGLVGSLESGSISCSFWNTQISGLADGVGNQDPDPIGVAGLDTAQMQTFSTFTSAGWDFVDVWGIVNLQTYPLLKVFSGGVNPADINYSGTVDMQDLAILAANWLKGE